MDPDLVDISWYNKFCFELFWVLERSASWCVYFVRLTTLLLCIFLFCIFLLYLTDPQTHSQCVKMQTPAITLWFPVHSFYETFLLGFFTWEKWFTRQSVFHFRSKHSFTSYHIFFLYLLDLHPSSHNLSETYQKLSV